MSSKKKPVKKATPASRAQKPKAKAAVRKTAPKKTTKPAGKAAKPKPVAKGKPAAKTTVRKPAAKPAPIPPKKSPVTSKTPAKPTQKKTSTIAPEAKKPAPETQPVAAAKTEAPAKAKNPRTTLDDLALDVDEKDELLEQEKRDLASALRDDEDEPLETSFVPTDTSERLILVVDEEGQRRNETVTIISQILPNAVIEVADDPEEAAEIMQEGDFDTYVVNFLMPGFSASPFVKSVANHPDHPLLIGFAADKISDALDQRKGLKIIPLKRLFDLDVSATASGEGSKGKPGPLDD